MVFKYFLFAFSQTEHPSGGDPHWPAHRFRIIRNGVQGALARAGCRQDVECEDAQLGATAGVQERGRHAEENSSL